MSELLVMVVLVSGCLLGCATSVSSVGNETNTDNTSNPTISATAHVSVDPLVEGGFTEVLPGVFDDGHGTVFIERNRSRDPEFRSISDMYIRKSQWTQSYPEKRLVQMIQIQDNAVARSIISRPGLLIHYEDKSSDR